jgi:carbon-monoxide dehydrogenase medium subunit
MIPAAFDYVRPASVADAVALLKKHGDDAKLLAGGHSLLPAMKLRLSQPKVVVDIGRIGDLRSIREENGKIAIGALATHAEIEASELLRSRCPLLPELAPHIGDAQVRNRGTIGGSLAHADPAGDWPAGVLAVDAELEVVGGAGTRWVRARDFFVDLYKTLLRPDEIIVSVRVPATPRTVAYVKLPQKASGFAIVGVAAVVDGAKKTVAVGVTGVAAKAYRARGVEEALQGKDLPSADLAGASARAAEGVEPLGDIHASAEFRGHLAQVYVRRALESAARRS